MGASESKHSGLPSGSPLHSSRPNGRGQLAKSRSTRFRAIADKFNSIDQVQEALRKQGLESSNLIVAVDFTKSNEWTGKHSFQNRSLHSIGDVPNPYETAITIIGKTLQAFDDDNLIPAYGFGDGKSSDRHLFSFLPGDQPCQGLEQVLWRYRELAPCVRLAGPTSFAPAIQQATQIVASSGQYHILLLIADGQVTRGSDLNPNELSPQERATIDAIVEASKYPLSIVMVGVGDGPWDMMRQFDDSLPARAFDNFQFVNLTEVVGQYKDSPQRMEAIFALRALMEIPEQYQAIKAAGLLGRCPPYRSPAQVLPPPGAGSYPSGHMAPPGYPSGHMAPGGYPSGGFPSAHQPGYPPQMYVQHPPYPPANAPNAPYPGASANPFAPPAAGPSAAAAAAAPAPAAPNPMFICPITQDVMEDPVIATDGHTYERSAISGWLQSHDSSPMTGAKMPRKDLVPNYSLKSAIQEAKQRGQI